jgi:hypothetical protein
MQKIHERIEKQKQERREEERHQEQMRKLQDTEDELYRMRLQPGYIETQNKNQGY